MCVKLKSRMDIWLGLFSLVLNCRAGVELVEEQFDVEMTVS